MSLPNHLTTSTLHLRSALDQSTDWRIRESITGAITSTQCALHLHQKIATGKLTLQPNPPATQPTMLSGNSRITHHASRTTEH